MNTLSRTVAETLSIKDLQIMQVMILTIYGHLTVGLSQCMVSCTWSIVTRNMLRFDRTTSRNVIKT